MPSSMRAKRRSAPRRPRRRIHWPTIWQRGKWWFIGVGGGGAIALLVVLTYAFSGPQARESELGLANAAPDMTLATLTGDFTLSENRGQVHLLYFSFPG